MIRVLYETYLAKTATDDWKLEAGGHSRVEKRRGDSSRYDRFPSFVDSDDLS